MTTITWQKGGSATLLSFDGQAIALTSTISSPPGSRLDGTLPSGLTVQVKVHACKKQGETFTLSGRVLNASRAVLDALRG